MAAIGDERLIDVFSRPDRSSETKNKAKIEYFNRILKNLFLSLGGNVGEYLNIMIKSIITPKKMEIMKNVDTIIIFEPKPLSFSFNI
ncbi:hypothetical protein [Rhizobium rhizosphaerae]|uniref:hypothetical protein n=1 Tax=Xaviernesmea rhizosphaerae TaxID=1672749 RepID=UPI00111A597A|nr:hypothetical protein [Xaviernesmea rhizosphaerae]